MVFQLKTPAVYDVAADDVGSLFTAPVSYGVYARASVGYFTDYSHTWQYHSVGRDSGIQRVWEDSRKRGYRFGPYHYTVQGGIAEQAKCFTDTLLALHISENGRYHAEFPPVLDVELECSGAALVGKAYSDMMKEWIDRVEQVIQTPVAIYTARPQWSYLLAGGSIAPEWIKGRLLWAKFYPYDDYIDRNATFPLNYLPAGWTMNQLFLWQYHDSGREHGFTANDLNVVTAVGQKLFDSVTPFPTPETPPPTPDPTPTTITVQLPPQGQLTAVTDAGVTYTGTPAYIHSQLFPNETPSSEPVTEAPLVYSQTVTLTHAGIPDEVTYFVLSVDPRTHEITTDTRPWMTYPHVFAMRNNLEYAANGGAGWNATTIHGAFRYQGTGFGTISNSWQQLYIGKDGRMSLTKPLLGGIYTTMPFTNLLVKGGVVQSINKPVDYRARTAIGQRADGTTIILVVSGGDYNQTHGLSFQETAELMQSLNCVLAVMVDGGGSSSMAYIDSNGKPHILTTNDAAEEAVTIDGVVYHIRPVQGHIGVRRKP